MPRDVHGDVLEGLGRGIASGTVAPGTVLTLAGLEQEFGASRTVAREAVKVLESMRMVSSRRRVGITVQPRSAWDALDPLLISWTLDGDQRQRQTHLESLMEMRVAVEPTAAALAATRASIEQRAELRRLAAQMTRLGERGQGASAAYLDADQKYHSLLLQASGNPLFSALAGAVREELAGRTRLGMHPAVPAAGTLDDHVRVAEAISSGNAQQAEMLSRRHLTGVWREILSARLRDQPEVPSL